MPTDLPALRTAARAAIDVPGTGPVRWRVVSIEYGGGIAPVCTASSYTTDADLGGATFPTHRLDPEVFGPDARDETGLYDCCPRPWIEVWSDEMAAYLVELLNGDADRDALVRAAALAEAADATAAWTGDDTPMEDRPGYDGPVIDPEDRLRIAIDPEVPLSLRDQLIAEHRQMVTDEITAELRRLATTPKEHQ